MLTAPTAALDVISVDLCGFAIQEGKPDSPATQLNSLQPETHKRKLQEMHPDVEEDVDSPSDDDDELDAEILAELEAAGGLSALAKATSSQRAMQTRASLLPRMIEPRAVHGGPQLKGGFTVAVLPSSHSRYDGSKASEAAALFRADMLARHPRK